MAQRKKGGKVRQQQVGADACPLEWPKERPRFVNQVQFAPGNAIGAGRLSKIVNPSDTEAPTPPPPNDVGLRTRSLRGQPSPARNPWAWLVPLPLIFVAVATFLPAVDNGFVAWDDDRNFLDNPNCRGLGPDQVKWAFSTFWLAAYQPFAWLFIGAEYLGWQLDPRGYHLVSIVLHVANSLGLYVLALSLLGRCRPEAWKSRRAGYPMSAGLATALYAVHPLRVEVVAWASCQPYLLSALFSILAVLAYLRAFRMGHSPEWPWIAGSFVLFVAALLSKSVSLGLPVVLLVLDVYPLRRLADGSGRWFTPAARRVLCEKVPFVAVSVVFAGLAIAARGHSWTSIAHNDPLAGIGQAGYEIWFNFDKTVLPFNLVVVYPPPGDRNWLAPPFIWRMVGSLVLTGAFFIMRRRWPGLLAAWLVYLALLAPNSGIIPFSGQIAADRYSYLATAGWVPVVAALFYRLWQAKLRARPAAVAVTVLVLGWLVGLCALAREQCRTWRTSETLWTHALLHGADLSAVAHYKMAILLYSQGRLDEAATHTATAIQLDPDDCAIRNFLGIVLQGQGNLSAAAQEFANAARLNPEYRDAHYNLGVILSRQGKFAAAAAQYAEVLRLDPSFADAHYLLGIDLRAQAKFAESEAHYREALRLNPDRVDARIGLGVVLSRQGKLGEAVAQYTEALRLDPGNAEARRNLEILRAPQPK
jgi:protein O-mannosyl-transferase